MVHISLSFFVQLCLSDQVQVSTLVSGSHLVLLVQPDLSVYPSVTEVVCFELCDVSSDLARLICSSADDAETVRKCDAV